MAEFKTANIKYSGLTDGKMTVTVIDGDKKKWSVWKQDYKDKTKESEVYRALQMYKFGEIFGVSYGEKEESFVNDKGQNVTFTRKTIYSIMPTITNPTGQTTSPVKKSSPEPVYSHTNEDKAPDWDAIAIGKTQSLFLAAYIQSGKNFGEALLQVAQARRLAEMVVAGDKPESFMDVPPPQEAPPEQEINIDGIPF